MFNFRKLYYADIDMKQSQTKIVLDVLRKKKKVACYVFAMLGIMQYNRCIHSLRKLGYNIPSPEITWKGKQKQSIYTLLNPEFEVFV